MTHYENPRAAVERMWHTKDSQSQILALDVLNTFKVVPSSLGRGCKCARVDICVRLLGFVHGVGLRVYGPRFMGKG